MARDLIVGYDDSDGARAALAVAIELAAELGDRVVIAFGAMPPGHVGEEFGAATAAVREVGDRLTAHALARAQAAGVDAEAVVVDARPAEALLRLADERDARMIVVGSHGEHPIKGALLGSTANKLLHLAERPVLAVRARHGDDRA
jgi:nucleotide-binding universal stress UspA family protein